MPCNSKLAKGGNYAVFITRLIKENGLEWWQKKEASSRGTIHYTRSDLEDLIAAYKAKLEAL